MPKHKSKTPKRAKPLKKSIRRPVRTSKRTPARKSSTVKKPTVKKPAVKKPTVKKPVVKKPVVKKSAMKKPAMKKPAEMTSDEIHVTVYNLVQGVYQKQCMANPPVGLSVSTFAQWMRDNNPSSVSTQKAIACFLNDLLKKHGVLDKVLYAENPDIKNIMKFAQLSQLGFSAQGVVAKVSIDNVPFATMKYAIEPTPDKEMEFNQSVLHEITVGLILNSIIHMAPNFMFTYGGFMCSPPVNISNIHAVKNIKQDLLKILLPNLFYKKHLMMTFPNACSDWSSVLQVFSQLHDAVSFLYTPRKTKITVQQVISHFEKSIRQMFTDVMDKGLVGDTTSWNRFVTQCNLFLSSLHAEKNNIEKLIYIVQEPVEAFNESLLCKPGVPKRILSLAQLIPNSTSMGEMLKSGDYSAEEIHLLLVQLYFSLFVANRGFEFVHYDLHLGNILITHAPGTVLTYKLPIDGGIQTVRFVTDYVAHIIDYGLATIKYQGYQVMPYMLEWRYYTKLNLYKDFIRLFAHIQLIQNDLMEREPREQLDERLIQASIICKTNPTQAIKMMLEMFK